MPEPEYSDDYTDPRLAACYDQLNPWGPADDFYLDLVMAAESVLDVGCGTGAVLRRARVAGHPGRLVGLDPAAAMLDQARVRTDIEWVLGDLRTGSVHGEFDLVIMTGHVFQVFLTDDEIRSALSAVRALGAQFAFETLNPRLRPWEQWTGSTEVVAADGAVVSAGNTEPRLVEDGIVEVVGRFTSPSWEREVRCPSRLRFVEVAELDTFLAEAGFAVVDRFGYWDRRPFTEQSPEIITIATPSDLPGNGEAPAVNYASKWPDDATVGTASSSGCIPQRYIYTPEVCSMGNIRYRPRQSAGQPTARPGADAELLRRLA